MASTMRGHSATGVGGEQRTGAVAVRDDGDRVVGSQAAHEQGERRLHETEALADVHRAGRVDDERDVRRRPSVVGRVDGR